MSKQSLDARLDQVLDNAAAKARSHYRYLERRYGRKVALQAYPQFRF